MPDIEDLRYDQAIDEVMKDLDPIDWLQDEMQENFCWHEKTERRIEKSGK